MILLTPKEAAKKAHVSAALVYGWVASGELAHVRVGAAGKRGKILIDESDLVKFLEARKAGGSRKPPTPARAKPVRLKHLGL